MKSYHAKPRESPGVIPRPLGEDRGERSWHLHGLRVNHWNQGEASGMLSHLLPVFLQTIFLQEEDIYFNNNPGRNMVFFNWKVSRMTLCWVEICWVEIRHVQDQCCPRSFASLSRTPSILSGTRILSPKLALPKPGSPFLPSRFRGFRMKSGRLENNSIGQALS